MNDNLEDIKHRRGRPLGFKLSEESKDKIRQKRLGTTHSEETKDKISRSLSAHFRSKDSLTDSLQHDYRFSPLSVSRWIDSNKSTINNSCDVLTNKRIVYFSQVEKSYGINIETYFSHNMTPEYILLLKEELQSLGLLDELYILNDTM